MIEKMYTGCYRVHHPDDAVDFFGQVKKNGNEWVATSRWSDGSFRMDEGIYSTLKEARAVIENEMTNYQQTWL